MKVLMLPQLKHFRSEESGIKRVIEAYYQMLPQFDIDLVDDTVTSYDLKVVHAGMAGPDNDVAMLHGLYWSADYDSAAWEYDANRRIVEAIRHAKQVTVPSRWVQETFQRDMRFSPHIIPHGIDWPAWQHKQPNEGYVLWNKNRFADVCKPDALDELSFRFPDIQFISTFGAERPNAKIFNTIINHKDMKRLIQRAGVYLSSTKETFGIGILEAMAAAVPVLGWAYGGNVDLIQHGINGYLAEPGNYEDLSAGLVYCLKHRKTLGANGRELARDYTWQAACEKVAGVYRLAMEREPATVGVVIPVYNKTTQELSRAIGSVLAQTYRANEVIVIDDGSQNREEIRNLIDGEYGAFVDYIYQENQGVAHARNNGISHCDSTYILCLDADDWIEPGFLEAGINELEKDRSLGIAYTGLRWHNFSNGDSAVSDWPPAWNYDNQLKKQNQIPTCCVFRREMWQRLGGYRQRYAPGGAGAEDAEFWLRAGAYGWAAKKVTDEPLFNYSLGGSVSGNKEYREPDWLAWQPWVKDGQHPFASYATPKRQSHPVRQYDQPVISVIIPVGPGHERDVINALDSLEAQTFRRWEVIIALDAPIEISELKRFITACPYAKIIESFDKSAVSKLGGYAPRGAGFARNRGADLARAPFILFLDADDTLHPLALEKMLEAYSRTGQAVYTDYVGQAFINEELAAQLDQEDRLQSYNPKDGEAIISYRAADFDCHRALRQPEEDNPYIWNLITTLIPRAWHLEIGGFDEQMPTWEDWDYWLRLARAGKCFYRLDEQLVRYRFYTGSRRSEATPDTESGRQKAQAMIKYLRNKYSEDEPMACGCKGNGALPAKVAAVAAVETSGNMANDGDFLRAVYTGSQGNHHVVGAYEFSQNPGLPTRQRNGKWVLYYGYIGRGREVLVHREDVRLMVGKWQPTIERVEAPKAEIAPAPEPVLMAAKAAPDSPAPFDLLALRGVNDPIAKSLKEAGLDTPEAIKKAGVKGLTRVKGITNTRANTILAAVKDL